jgi:hypothetical protein
LKKDKRLFGERAVFERQLSIIASVLLFLMVCCVPPSAVAEEPNDLVKFLVADWECTSFEVSDGKPVKKEVYLETMVAKDRDTLTITAHEYRDGKDLTRDMHLEVKGAQTTLRQGGFEAKGVREGNVYSFSGKDDGKQYRLRLYTMGDKYVFHRVFWSDGQVQQVDMSYLIRKR